VRAVVQMDQDILEHRCSHPLLSVWQQYQVPTKLAP
jgi:hypothetical protein